METAFTVDDVGPVPGRRAIYFSRKSPYFQECDTLGYACTVLGQVHRRVSPTTVKQFLVHIDLLDAPVIVNESDLAPCEVSEAPPILAQGELVVAWFVPEVEMVGVYRANRWVPFSGFRIRAANVTSLQHQRWENEEGGVTLLCESPTHLELDVDLVVSVLGKLANQRCWRVLPVMR